MNRKPGLYSSGIILLFMFGVAAWAWPQVPADAQIPVHWNVSGTPNGFAGKLQGLLGLPLIAAAVAGLFVLIPSIEPRRRHLSESGTPYTVTWIGVLALMAVLQLAAVSYALGNTRLAGVVGLATLGGLFIVIGNYLGKVRSNFMFGIRTPWTLTSEVSWNKTHRLGGRLFFLLGIALIATALLGKTVSAVLVAGGAVLIAVVVCVYSYLIWRADRQSRPSGAEGSSGKALNRKPARWRSSRLLPTS